MRYSVSSIRVSILGVLVRPNSILKLIMLTAEMQLVKRPEHAVHVSMLYGKQCCGGLIPDDLSRPSVPFGPDAHCLFTKVVC